MMIKLVCAVFAVLTISGCGGASLHDVEVAHAHNEGTTRLYEVPAPRALEIARDVLKSEGASPVMTGSEPNEILATISPSVVPYRFGAQCGVWVIAQDDSHARVTVVTKRSASTVGTGLTETTFHDDFARTVASSPSK